MKTRFWAILFCVLALLCLWGIFREKPAVAHGDLSELSDAVTSALLRSEEARAVFRMRETQSGLFL